jgi:type VI secretion system secreted protein Hcp
LAGSTENDGSANSKEDTVAIDVYLSLEGIKGESTDEGHKGWIECQSVHWAISQPKSATSSTAGGHSAERCDMTDISFIKIADLATPLLAQSCASGRTLPRAKFEFLRADGAGGRVLYFEIELTCAMIGHLAPGIEAGSILTEAVGLKFAKVVWRYTQQKVSGGSAGNTQGGWDLSNNKVCA